MRKFLRKFFWYHRAPLGYLSQKGHPEIFSKWVLINLSNPLRHPAPLVDPLLTKKFDTAGPWCEYPISSFAFMPIPYILLTQWFNRPNILCKLGIHFEREAQVFHSAADIFSKDFPFRESCHAGLYVLWTQKKGKRAAVLQRVVRKWGDIHIEPSAQTVGGKVGIQTEKLGHNKKRKAEK